MKKEHDIRHMALDLAGLNISKKIKKKFKFKLSTEARKCNASRTFRLCVLEK